MRFGCRKNKYRVGRRFFYCFEQGVERLLGEHMNLVYYIYLLFTADRYVQYLVTYLADIVNTSVARRVHLVYIGNTAV